MCVYGKSEGHRHTASAVDAWYWNTGDKSAKAKAGRAIGIEAAGIEVCECGCQREFFRMSSNVRSGSYTDGRADKNGDIFAYTRWTR